MIRLLDELVVDPARLAELRELLATAYVPGAQARGMQLAAQWLSPPVALPDAPNTLWLLWQLPDLGAWWAMRAQAAMDPSVTALWQQVDALCQSRRRHVLAEAVAPLAEELRHAA